MSAVHSRGEWSARLRGTESRRVAGTAPGVDRAWANAVLPMVGHVLSWTFVLVSTGLVTWLVVATHGAPNPLVHLYYVPILYASARHGSVGALAGGSIAGLAAGPWMPTASPTTDHQTVQDWMVRLVLFVGVGIVAAWLARQQPRPLDSMLRDVVVGQALRSAVRHHQIRVHYQPLIDLTDGTVMGVEALCRWDDAKGKPVPPQQFIPVAERTGVICAVGREVLDQASRQAQQWRDDALPDFLMTINVSAIQLGEPKFLVDLTAAAGLARGRSARLCVEITETAIMVDPVRALATLEAARALGVTIAIDDFGTGHSSLTYLATFPIDIIKIDKSFIDDIDTDAKASALVHAIIQMAQSLGVATIAEGIEREAQVHALRELGCEVGQGYYLGRPSEANAVNWDQRSIGAI